jgi:DNA-binding MarR family transcriptional regulator
MTLANIIVQFYEKLSAWESRKVKGSGISIPLMHTIEIIGIFGKMRMKELAEKIGVTTGTLTVTIDKLEKEGFVMRIPNPDDRRSLFIVLTETGMKMHKEHTREHEKLTKLCIKNFSKDQIEGFAELLTIFSDSIPT